MQKIVVWLFEIFQLVALLNIFTDPSELDWHLIHGQVQKINFHLSNFKLVLILAPRYSGLIDDKHDCEAKSLQIISSARIIPIQSVYRAKACSALESIPSHLPVGTLGHEINEEAEVDYFYFVVFGVYHEVLGLDISMQMMSLM